jgi:DNA-binding response OmpR family regulator
MENKIKILLVDDDEKIRQTLRDILEEKGYLIDEACDGEEAYMIMRNDFHHLIFMDIKMPHLDGFLSATFIGLKHNPEVVFITGQAKDAEVKRILEGIPSSCWFEKPVDPGKILEIAHRTAEKFAQKGA